MSEVRYCEINGEEAGQRLDNYLLRILKGVPKSHIYRLIRGGEVRINKKRAKPDTRLFQGDVIRIPPVRTAKEQPIQVGVSLKKLLSESVIYEDAHLLVINKPAGLAVHGGSGLSLGVIEAFRKLRSDLHYLELVHRLDKDTSGCLVLAKKRSALRAIHALLEARQVNKIYWALMANAWKGKEKIIVNQPLEKNILKSGERIVTVQENAKSAQTAFKLLENFGQACLVEAKPKTGRTHQIRVHSNYVNHPIIGDRKYGDVTYKINPELIKRALYLHAYEIQFTLDNKDYHFRAELDKNFSQTLALLRLGSR